MLNPRTHSAKRPACEEAGLRSLVCVLGPVGSDYEQGGVVTTTEAGAPVSPDALRARTLKMYVVDGLTGRVTVVAVTVARRMPPRNTS